MEIQSQFRICLLISVVIRAVASSSCLNITISEKEPVLYYSQLQVFSQEVECVSWDIPRLGLCNDPEKLIVLVLLLQLFPELLDGLEAVLSGKPLADVGEGLWSVDSVVCHHVPVIHVYITD